MKKLHIGKVQMQQMNHLNLTIEIFSHDIFVKLSEIGHIWYYRGSILFFLPCRERKERAALIKVVMTWSCNKRPTVWYIIRVCWRAEGHCIKVFDAFISFISLLLFLCFFSLRSFYFRHARGGYSPFGYSHGVPTWTWWADDMLQVIRDANLQRISKKGRQDWQFLQKRQDQVIKDRERCHFDTNLSDCVRIYIQ